MQLEEISIDVVGSFSGGIMPRDASRIYVLRKVCFLKINYRLLWLHAASACEATRTRIPSHYSDRRQELIN